MDRLLIFVFLVSSFYIDNSLAAFCKNTEGCSGDECEQTTECLQGECQSNGTCKCHPCFTGPICNDYVDVYKPYFLKEEETVYIEPSQRGLVYEVAARDEDVWKTCQRDGSVYPCPCAGITYEIFNDSSGKSYFYIHQSTGELFLNKSAIIYPGEKFKIEIVTSNYQEGFRYEENALTIDMLTVHINVLESNKIQNYWNEDEHNENTISTFEQDSISLENVDISAKSLTRQKRKAFGTLKADSNYTLTLTNTVTEPVKPGMTMDFKLTIILPELPTLAPMTLLVEIFLMDAITAITTLSLCDVKVVSIGALIGPITLSQAQASVDMQTNTALVDVYDRALINFGTLTNTDTAAAATSYDDSTIIITFKATQIKNTAFTNSFAVVTAGTEYDSENYVWVSQANFTYDNTEIAFPNDITLKGPDTAKQWTGATFDIDAFITIPSEKLEFEVFSPSDVHDRFSVEAVRLESLGSNHACGFFAPIYTYKQSVSGKTNHKGSVTFAVSTIGIDHSTLLTETTDVGNKISFSFTVFFYAAEISEIVTIGAGISLGTSTIWTALANVTIAAGVSPPAPSTTISSLTVTPVDTSATPPAVGVKGSATFDVHAILGSEASVQITCTATTSNVADAKVCGVLYGKSGKYVSLFPNLVKLATYDTTAGSASWTFITNTSSIHPTDQTRTSNEDFVSMEVTVLYPSATPGTVTVTCNGNSVTLTAASGTAGTQDMTGVTTLLGSSTWYYKGQAGIMATLTFPGGGLGYGNVTLESSADFFTTTWGARVCQVDVIKIGRQIGCVAPTAGNIQAKQTLKKIAATSVYDDSTLVNFGGLCGSKRDSSATILGDSDVKVRIIYDIPSVQTVVAGNFNISAGVFLDSTIIWTGWKDFTISTASPTVIIGKDPIFTVINPTSLTPEMFAPVMFKAYVKTYKGTSTAYTITATSGDPAIFEICRLYILNVGRNYACIDTNPYGKNSDPAQRVTIIHDATNWGLSATINMGIVTNLGTEDIDSSRIGDEDTIEFAIVGRGIAVGSTTLTIVYNDGVAETNATTLTIGPDVLKSTNTLGFNVTGFDGTLNFYNDAMTKFLIKIIVPSSPAPYDKPVVLEVANTNNSTMTICYLAVSWAGANLPCVVSSKIIQNVTIGAAGEDVYLINFPSLCYMPISSNASESEIHLHLGLLATNGTTTGSVTLKLTEDGIATTTKILNYADGGLFNPGNFSTTGVTLNVVQNATVTSVEPGQRVWLGLYVGIPRDVTIPIELAVMTSASAGHAYATVHGFRWGASYGKNIQCPAPLAVLKNNFFKNSSTDGIPLVHSSQNDTMTVNLGYLSNTGLTYMQYNQKPADDLAMLEAELLIADHNVLISGSIITVTFSVKMGDVIMVASKNLTLTRPPTVNKMVLKSEMYFKNSSITEATIFSGGEKLEMGVRIQHILNQSTIEAYDAIVRILLPSYIKYVNASSTNLIPGVTVDSYISNITANITVLEYLDFDIDYLFFTDILELNFTVTVDPDASMPKGLDLLNSTALFRFICREGSPTAVLKYCGTPAFVNYITRGTDCFEDLNMTSFQDCQFLASSAIDTAVNAPFSKTATGWSPAVRDTTAWGHYIIVDFLKEARLTKIKFTAVTGKRGVGTYKLQYSLDGITFLDVSTCLVSLSAATENLPIECRYQSRYFKLTILSSNDPDETKALGVNFLWYGCYVTNATAAACGLSGTTTLSNLATEWRHAAYDTTHSIVYFCDYNPKRKRMVCYSSSDSGANWNALPSYIGSLKGFDATTGKMYAYDLKKAAVVSSIDGVSWLLVDSTVAAALVPTPPTAIPGYDQSSLTPLTLGTWTADFVGMKIGTTYKVKWGSCCQ